MPSHLSGGSGPSGGGPGGPGGGPGVGGGGGLSDGPVIGLDDDDVQPNSRMNYDYPTRQGQQAYMQKSKSSSYLYEDRAARLKKYTLLMSRPGLRKQFERFARYGEPRASGDFINQQQTEKWLKQAGIIDNWNVTTTDTAIIFRKVSKGSKWLDYDNWRIFLEEVAWRKRLNIEYLIEKLELAGKPFLMNPTLYSATSSTGKASQHQATTAAIGADAYESFKRLGNTNRMR